jgi:murein L,D-transpeptidase YafK
MAVVALVLAACQADDAIYGYGPKDQRPISEQTRQLMAKLDMTSSSPVLMRIFKEESTFEVWKQDKTGRYALLKSYPICKWSGGLGPKVREGDRQAPEGFYPISPGLLNPKSDWYLAFNTGFPNAYDRANGRTGSALMVHGSCSSRGCYAMTDAQIQEIYGLARDAFKGGQKAFQLEAFPFRLTAENMAKHWNDPNMPFWKMLKEGYDTFEMTRLEPKVDVCGRKYVFNAKPAAPLDTTAACPADLGQPAELVASLAARAKADDARAETLYAELEKKRKADEDTRIQLALAAEAKQKREEADRLEAARNPSVLSSLFAKADADRDVDAGIRVGPVVVPPEGAPVPMADPRGPSAHAVALAEPEPAQRSSIAATFSRLFSGGSDEAEAPAAAPATTPVVATSPAPVVPAPASASVSAPGLIVPKAGGPAGLPAMASQPNLPPPAPACAPAGTVAAGGVPVCPARVATQGSTQPVTPCAVPGSANPTSLPWCAPVAAPVAIAEPPKSRSIIDRIGSWF